MALELSPDELNKNFDDGRAEPEKPPETEVKAEVVNKPAPPAVTKPALMPIPINAEGALAPRDSNEAWRVAQLMLDSRAIPAHFQNVPQVVMATQFLRVKGIDPNVGLRNTMIVNGSITLWGELPKALVDKSGLCEFFDEYLIDDKYVRISLENKNLHVAAWAAICAVKRKGLEKQERHFSMKDAETAGLTTKNKSLWKVYPSRMLQMRARSLALKDVFPDVLGGIAIAEYDHDQLPTHVPPNKSLAESLNAEYLEKKADA